MQQQPIESRPNPKIPGKKTLNTTLVWGVGMALVLLLAGFAGWQMNGLWQANRHALVHLNEHDSPFQLAANRAPRGPHLFGDSPSLIADVVEQIAPSVVNIDIERPLTGRGGLPNIPFFGSQDIFERFFGFGGGSGSPFQRYPGLPGGGQAPVISGNGSGVVLDAQGHVLTNNHVITSASKITVSLQDGRKLPATVLGSDPYTDLAVLKVDAPNLKPITLGQSNHLRPGDWVLAVGSPLGFDHTVTLGIISGISRRIPDLNSNVEFIQTDAAINPGNSGGPLVNLYGDVIGINTAISDRGQNIGFAIPVDTARDVAEAIIRNGTITRPWIGISMMEMNPDLAKSLGLQPNTPGVVVAEVVAGSPSARAGLMQGDVVQQAEGQRIEGPKDLQDLVRTKPLNTPLHLQVIRQGRMMAISVTTEALPSQPTAQ